MYKAPGGGFPFCRGEKKNNKRNPELYPLSEIDRTSPVPVHESRETTNQQDPSAPCSQTRIHS